MLVQICPALMDWTVFLVLFAVLYGAGERGFSGLQCAWIGGIDAGLFYSLRGDNYLRREGIKREPASLRTPQPSSARCEP